jgi:acetylornithine deacetylase/succinyl-diaminopimelate desuccinylase-like protein
VDKKSKLYPKLYTGAIDKNGINIPSQQMENIITNGNHARSASDDKAGVDAILNAYDAINKSGLKPTYNLKFF